MRFIDDSVVAYFLGHHVSRFDEIDVCGKRHSPNRASCHTHRWAKSLKLRRNVQVRHEQNGTKWKATRQKQRRR